MFGPTQTIIRLYSKLQLQIYIILDSTTCPNVNNSQITNCTVRESKCWLQKRSSGLTFSGFRITAVSTQNVPQLSQSHYLCFKIHGDYIFFVFRLLLPLALQPAVGFGLSNNVLPFFPICHQLSPSSHFQHLKISFYFLFPSFPGSSPSSRPFQFLSEDLFGHPILLHSL